MSCNHVIAILSCAGVCKKWKLTDGSFAAMNLDGVSLSNHTCLSNVSERVFAIPHLLIHIVQDDSSISAAPSPANPKLAEALNNTVRNSESIPTLPLDAIPRTLQADIQILQPADSRPFVEWTGCRHRRIAA